VDKQSVQLLVRPGMQVFEYGGGRIGKVWNVHTRDAETYVEVHPQSFWRGIIDGIAPRYADPERGHLYLPARFVRQVQGKRVILALRRDEAMECTDRPAWLSHDKEIMPAQLY
jgi:hypothetical protein